MAKKKTYTFSENRQAKSGITSVVLGVLALIILAAMAGIACWQKGNAGMYIGAFGFTSAVMSLSGMIVGQKPGRSALVLSHISARTPFFPISANLCRSMTSPKTGV